jgi:PAP2 superfamily protein
MRTLAFYVVVTLCSCLPTFAGDLAAPTDFLTTRPARDPWNIDWRTVDATPPIGRGLVMAKALSQQPPNPLTRQQPVHAVAIQHSDAYETRAKIHKYASYATLPLFAGEIALGQSLFSSSTPGGGNKGLHSAVGAGIIGLFGVNTVTGAWNLFGEGWQEHDGRTLRLAHGLLMFAADAGFVATWASAPHNDRFGISSTFDHDKRVHRNIAFASIGVGTAGYLVMLLANHGPFAHAQDNTGQTPDGSGGVATVSGTSGTTSIAAPVETASQPAETSPAQPAETSPAQPADTTPPETAETSPGQTGINSPAPVNTTPGSTNALPKVAHTGLSTLFRDTALDYAHFPRRESTWWILGIGGALAASLSPLDDDVNAHLVSSGAADKIWKPGHIIGGPVMYIAPPAVYVYGRYILPMFNDDTSVTNKWSHMGLDLVRAELLQEGLVQAIKVSVNRTRPNGQNFSFPSGHAAATFAFASVIERHLGARLAWPTLLIATYVGTSRLHDNVHFLSDVVFGAALGTAAGWTVVGRHGSTNYSLMPTPVPGGMAFMVTRTPRTGN